MLFSAKGAFRLLYFSFETFLCDACSGLLASRQVMRSLDQLGPKLTVYWTARTVLDISSRAAKIRSVLVSDRSPA